MDASSSEPIKTETPDLEKLRKKYFPRVPWREGTGPVRRRVLARAVTGEEVLAVLTALAAREGFTEPGCRTAAGDAAACLEALLCRAAGGPVGMIFGTEPAAFWCDIALGPLAADGWQPYIIRSEEGENLTALAHAEGLLRFARAHA